ncbi:hypothetical protein VTK56DRAFT_8361 [Thermocarpiscus australiensis]
MPPRIHGSSCQPQLLLNCIETATSTPASSLSQSLRCLKRPAAAAAATATPSSPPQSSRPFSTTPPREAATLLRRKFHEFMDKHGHLFRRPQRAGPSYLCQLLRVPDGQEVPDDQPFPNNPAFRSEPVLSESARELIWKAVMREGMPLKAVSAQFSIDMRRVAAVVRMKEIEKKWKREQKPLAYPYARAIQRMLPRAFLREGEKPFEPINDIHVHSYTMQQLFVPAPESREFTRADAARAFGDRILPPDAKMRIPELVQMERDIAAGVPPRKAYAAFVEAAAQSERELAARRQARAQHDEERRVRVDTGRFEFRFEKINAEDVGRSGRSRRGVGWRYGVPFYDRKRGEVKIPTSVE